MVRFEDSEGLFGEENPPGTGYAITCQVCGEHYPCEESILIYENFAGLEVCHCCFGKIEEEILRRMPDILKWYARILRARKDGITVQEVKMREIKRLSESPDPAVSEDDLPF